MRVKKWHKGLIAAVTSASLFGVGCAQDVGDIDRTQPDKVQKALFETGDEWYYMQTVVDTDVQGSVIFEALQSQLKRVRWEVTESTLLACSTVEPVLGLSESWNGDRIEGCHGVVAAFPITGHFDIQRQYNPTTGEPTNVISENTSDRPWYDREYMRVDWSTNLIDGMQMFQNQMGALAPVKYAQPQNWGDEINPNRTRLADDYIDTTTSYIFEPDIMACYGTFGFDSIYNCEGGQFEIRNSFMKVAPNKDKEFEPFVMVDSDYMTNDKDDVLMTARVPVTNTENRTSWVEVECSPEVRQHITEVLGQTPEQACQPRMFQNFGRFGYFRTDRARWDNQRPDTDFGRRHYANHHNIWVRAFDENGESIPTSERVPKPIVYHLNAEYPKNMIPAAMEVMRQWDEAFLDVVRQAKYPGDEVEVGLEKVRQDLKEAWGEEQDGHMFVIAENNCMPSQLGNWLSNASLPEKAQESVAKHIDASLLGNAEALEAALWDVKLDDRTQLCAELEFYTENLEDPSQRFTWQRVGDLRFNFFNWIDEFNGRWSGYGPSASDPLSGEIIQGAANFAGASLRQTIARAADMIMWMNGDLTDQQIGYGEHIRKYINKYHKDFKAAVNEELSEEASEELVRRMGGTTSEQDDVTSNRVQDVPLPEEFLRLGKVGLENQFLLAAEASDQAMQAQIERTRDFFALPETKAMVLRDTNMMEMVKAQASQTHAMLDPDEEALHETYLDMQVPMALKGRLERRNKFFEGRNIFTQESAMLAVENVLAYRGVADYFKRKDGESLDEVRARIEDYFRDKLFIGTQLHEVGHTVGLRHNFIASTDAINYHDEFWKVREAIAKGQLAEEDADSISGDLAERIVGKKLDYLNEAEFRLASVMDYTGDLTGRFQGLGKYDHAAVHYVYGRNVQVWDTTEMPDLFDNLDFYLQYISHWKNYPDLFVGKLRDASGEEKVQGIQRMLEARTWTPLRQAQLDIRDGILANTTNVESVLKGDQQENLKLDPATVVYDRVVPFRFCTDDRRGSFLNCSVFDWGTSQREIVNQEFIKYRLFQPLYRTRRGYSNNFNEHLSSYYGRALNALTAATTPFRWSAFVRNWSDVYGLKQDLLSTALDAFNFYSEVLATPNDGVYCQYKEGTFDHFQNPHLFFDGMDEKTFVPARFFNNNGRCADDPNALSFVIPRGPGQPFGYDITDEYDFRINYIGSFVDKTVATSAYFNISANFFNSQLWTDNRFSNISYWNLFTPETLRIAEGLILEDPSKIGGIYDLKDQVYRPRRLTDSGTFGLGIVSPDEKEASVYLPVSFNNRFNFLAGAMISGNTYVDRNVDFSNYARIIVNDGSENQNLAGVDCETGVNCEEFVHPETGQRYRAPYTQTTGPDGEKLSLSVKLVLYANKLKDEYLKTKVVLQQAREDYRKSLETNASQTVLDTDEAAVATAFKNHERFREALEERVNLMEEIRFVWEALGPRVRR